MSFVACSIDVSQADINDHLILLVYFMYGVEFAVSAL